MKEILEVFAARIKSPVFGYFIFSWVAFNWKPLFYLFFSTTKINDRFQHFDKLTNGYSLVLFPLITASVIAITYPWISYVFLYLSRKPIDLKNYLQAESENKLLIKKKRLEEVRSVYLATKEKDLIDRAKRDEEIQSISDEETKEKLQKQIEKLRKEIYKSEKDQFNIDRSTNSECDLSHTYKQMADLLTKKGELDKAKTCLEQSLAIQNRLASR